MRRPFSLTALLALASIAPTAAPAVAQQREAWCGQFLIGAGPNAPRAAIASVTDLARILPRSCRQGDILYVTNQDGIAADVAPMLCDYSRTITIEAHPRDRGGGTSVTCAWIGYLRATR